MKAQEQIREWLAHEGRKHGWLAGQVPATPSTMSHWLAGTFIPSPPARRRLQDITGLPVSDESAWK